MSSFLAELQRRNVYKVGVAYAIVAWLLIQAADILLPAFNAPDWVLQTFIIIIILGLPVALVLAWAFELTPEGIKPTESVESPERLSVQTGKKLNGLIISLLCLVIVVMIIDNYVLVDVPGSGDDTVTAVMEEGITETAPETVNNSDLVTITDKSVAVLPFVSMSTDEEQQYFADGLSEEILNRLAQVPELKVAARTSSFSFKDKDLGISAIGEILDVAYVLEGSVRRSEDTLRVTAQLIRASDDLHLWSKTFDRPLNDVFLVQDEIAKEVTEAMQVSLGVAELSRMPGMTTNFLAYDAYLKGSNAFEFTSDDIGQAVVHLQDAVELDPEFALAWQALLGVYGLSFTVIPNGLPDAQMKSIRAFTKVQELAPDAPYAISNRASLSLNQGDWVTAEKVIRQAMQAAEEYGVSDEFSNLELALLRFTGRSREARDFVKQAMITDPLNEGLSTALIELYTSTGEIDLALAEAERGAGEDWDSMQRTGSTFVAALASRDRELIERIAAESTVMESQNAQVDAINSTMMELIDDPEAAISELEKRIIAAEHQSILDQSVIAIWAAYFDKPELAMTALKGTRRAMNFLLQNAWSSLFSDVRKLPEFAGLMTEIGLANYWRQTGNWADACQPVAGGLTFECG